MAIAYESENSTSANATSINVTKPSGTVEGDLLVCVVGYGNDDGTATLPAGWTEVDDYTLYSSGNDRSQVGYKFAGGSEPSSYSFSQSSFSGLRALIQRFSGADSYGGVSQTATAASSTCDFSSVTPDQDDCLLVLCGAGNYGFGGADLPSGYSNRMTPRGTGADIFIASKVQATAAATGTITSTTWTSASGYYQRGNQLWFRPPGGGGGGNALPMAMHHYRRLRA